MQPNTFAIVGGDMRQIQLSALLEADGHRVSTFALDQAKPRDIRPAASLEAAVTGAACVILPLPLSKDGRALNTPLSDTALTMNALFSALRPEQIICGGLISQDIHHQAKAHNLRLLDYYTREELIIAGAVATAEGAIQIAMEQTAATLLHSRCLVIGFGRIGKLLAHRLHALGARVTVSARKWADLAWIAAWGYEGIHRDALETVLPACNLVFNTVPHLILGPDQLARLDKGTLCIDLSSSPGGIDFGAASSLGIQTIWARGLPGKAAPLSTAAALRDTIYNMLGEQRKQP